MTGLIAQQQCCGPLHLPVADVAVVAQSFMDTCGAAVAVGEQPLKAVGGTLEDYRAMGRLSAAHPSVGENSLTSSGTAFFDVIKYRTGTSFSNFTSSSSLYFTSKEYLLFTICK